MMIKKKIKSFCNLIINFVAYSKKKIFDPKPFGDKILYVKFTNPNLYHRFFYTLLKFYKLDGYQIIYPMDFARFQNLRNKEHYLSKIVRNPIFLIIKNYKKPQNAIEIRDDHFDNHYFKGANQNNDSFYVPMPCHPRLYYSGVWNADYVKYDKDRINSIYCFGNFDAVAYLEIDNTDFGVLNRIQLLNFFKEKENFRSINSEKDFQEVINERKSELYYFSEKRNYSISTADVRRYLSEFNFFLSCPGVVYPLCHNLVEAMSVGTIPIIQTNYANILHPPLEDMKNAIIFNDLEDLDTKLQSAIFTLTPTEIEKLREGVVQYYTDFLTPKSVVKSVNKHLGKNKIHLNSGRRSVDFISTILVLIAS